MSNVLSYSRFGFPKKIYEKFKTYCFAKLTHNFYIQTKGNKIIIKFVNYKTFRKPQKKILHQWSDQ